MAREVDPRLRDRVRAAAMRRFAAEGFAATTLAAVAEEAGLPQVSVGEVFSSTDAMRLACDERVHEVLRMAHEATEAQGPAVGVRSVMSRSDEPMLMATYLGRLAAEGIPGPTALFARMVAMTAESLEVLVACGSVHPRSDPEARSALLFCLRAGALLADAVDERGEDGRVPPGGLVHMARLLMGILRSGVRTTAGAVG